MIRSSIVNWEGFVGESPALVLSNPVQSELISADKLLAHRTD